MTQPQPNPHPNADPADVVRCDWCGEPVDVDEGDHLHTSVFEGVDEWNVTPDDVADAVAVAIKNVGGPRDKVLADTIRENNGYSLHSECLEETALTEVYDDA